MAYKHHGKHLIFPDIINFENEGKFYYTIDGFRRPKKGEFYLSGAIVSAFKAPNDLDQEYFVVVPMKKSTRR